MDSKNDKREVRAEDLADTILWKLGLRHESNGSFDDIWQRLKTAASKEQLARICGFLSDLLNEAIAHRLQLVFSTSPGERTDLETLWRVLKGWVVADEKRRLPLVKHLLLQALRSKPATPAATPAVATPPPLPPKQVNVRTNPPPPPAPPVKAAPRPAPPPVATALPTEVVTALPAEEEQIPTLEPVDATPPPSRPPAAGSGWVYRPVPEDEPDRHQDNANASLDLGDGYRLIGARARGKKHKHEATNCDDWFEWQRSGPWTIIAVADGAGSRRLSRLGAKVSCQRAVAFLADALSGAELARDWPAGSVPLAKDPEGKDYLTPGIVFARNCLHEAFVEAYKAVERHAESIRASEPHKRQLGRPVDVNDLSATLLLALHRPLTIGGVPQSLVLSCQIGDGAVAIIDRQAHVRLLGHADSGDFSGETDFLTSRRQLEPPNLLPRTSVQTTLLRALFVMTDGVADDYFPADPGLARLYADLVLNGVLLPGAASAVNAPKTDSLPPDIDSAVQVSTPNGLAPVRLRSASMYAAALNCRPADLATSPDLLRAGARDTPLGKLPTAEDRLLQWLDAYQVRGSFDDRTLVVLHCEKDG